MKKELSDSQKVKKELTKKFPELKISVRGGWATHTAKIDVSIIEIKNSFINPIQDYKHDTHYVDIDADTQVQGLTSFCLIRKGKQDATRNFTGKTKEVIDDIFKIIETHYGKHESGDSMIDSFDNYFYDIDFGKWDKPLIYNGISINDMFEHLEYAEEKEYPYRNIVTTGAPKTFNGFDELQASHLEYLLSLMPKAKETKKESTSHENSNFDDLFQSAAVEDFTHTKSGELLKVLKLTTQLSREDFKDFRTELKNKALGYYSRYAKGFVLEEKGLLCKTV